MPGPRRYWLILLSSLLLAACTGSEGNEVDGGPTMPPEPGALAVASSAPATAQATATILRPLPSISRPPPTLTSVPTSLPSPTPVATPTPEPPQYGTLDDFWNGDAEWVLDVYDTGLPVGESDTVYRGGDEYWSYLHASFQSAGVVDQCGDPVPFPGCTTLWRSTDGGQQFQLETATCLFACNTCPCVHEKDHISQQQYPRVAFQEEAAYLVYEFGAYVYLRSSVDGLGWTEPAHIPGTWIWTRPYGPCGGFDVIGEHPHIFRELQYDCLVGGPPGIYLEGDMMYVFVALGQAPGHMGCFAGPTVGGAAGLRPCASNPLFAAEGGYGPVEVVGPEANPYFEFRTISSADVVRVGQRYYMSYEGVRGPSSPTVVDDQFGLGLARSTEDVIDGPWEKFPGNPIIQDLPGNVGIGHADLLIVGDATYLYTATSNSTRGRYLLLRTR